METFFAGLGIQQILILGLGIIAAVFILKKLFKLAIIIAVIMFLVYYVLPIIQPLLVNYQTN